MLSSGAEVPRISRRRNSDHLGLLKGSAELIRSRMKHRPKHFMKADMLASQFIALEEPSDAIVVDISQPPSAIVAQFLARLRRLQPTLQNDATQEAEKRICLGKECEMYPWPSKRTLLRSKAKQGGNE